MTFCFIVLFNDEQTNNLHSKLTFISSQLSHYENVEKSLTMKQIFFLPHLICKTKENPIKKKERGTAKATIDLRGAYIHLQPQYCFPLLNRNVLFTRVRLKITGVCHVQRRTVTKQRFVLHVLHGVIKEKHTESVLVSSTNPSSLSLSL